MFGSQSSEAKTNRYLDRRAEGRVQIKQFLSFCVLLTTCHHDDRVVGFTKDQCVFNSLKYAIQSMVGGDNTTTRNKHNEKLLILFIVLSLYTKRIK